jgi:hypothetical protein
VRSTVKEPENDQMRTPWTEFYFQNMNDESQSKSLRDQTNDDFLVPRLRSSSNQGDQE